MKIIADFRKSLERKGVNINRLILFGSYVAGKQHEESDIDLIVVSDDFGIMDYWKRIDIIADAIFDIMKPIEAVAMTIGEWEKGDSMIAEFARNGEVVFAA